LKKTVIFCDDPLERGFSLSTALSPLEKRCLSLSTALSPLEERGLSLSTALSPLDESMFIG
jgi:hypothetical protein